MPGLFGSDKFSAGEHQYLIITEGAKDALSMHQVTRSPVVSVQSASSAVSDCIAGRSFVNSFERVYLALDGDAPGREAADAVAKLFDYNKLYQIKFDKYKDANDYLRAGESSELLNLFKNAKRYQPDKIVSHLEEFDEILKKEPEWGAPFPFESLTRMTYGIKPGDVVLITAQEGVGKTELMHAIEYKLLTETKDAIGAIYLEETKRRHLQAIAGIHIGRPAHLPDSGVTAVQAAAAVREVVGVDERLHIYSHFGSDDADGLLDVIRFLVSARGCRYVLFDHITMAVSGLAGEADERRALDYISTRLEMMVKELNFALIMVSHVNDDGKTRGSRNISKVCSIRIDVERDLLATTEAERNTTKLKVSKNRDGSKTGPCCDLLFDHSTLTYKELGDAVWPVARTTYDVPANNNDATLEHQGRTA